MTTTNAERVAKSRAALVARGGVKLPTGYLQPDAAKAVDYLLDAGYADTKAAVISRALIDAQKLTTGEAFDLLCPFRECQSDAVAPG